MPMVMLLPTGKYDYDLYPLTEELIEIDEDGNDTTKVVFYDGVIGVDDQDLKQLRITKKFADDLRSVVDMTEEELAEQQAIREHIEPAVERETLTAKLVSMDYLTNKYVEGKLGKKEWNRVVEERDQIRHRLKELR